MIFQTHSQLKKSNCPTQHITPSNKDNISHVNAHPRGCKCNYHRLFRLVKINQHHEWGNVSSTLSDNTCAEVTMSWLTFSLILSDHMTHSGSSGVRFLHTASVIRKKYVFIIKMKSFQLQVENEAQQKGKLLWEPIHEFNFTILSKWTSSVDTLSKCFK